MSAHAPASKVESMPDRAASQRESTASGLRDEVAGTPSYLVQRRCAACAGGDAGAGAESSGRRDGAGARGPAATREASAPHAARSASADMTAVARSGVAQASRPLPGYQRIQAAFGRHDVSGVRVQIGGVAESAAARLGARAYTTGNRVAFRSEPDLHLAAHEAAHVVQQRRGVHLKDGFGRANDRYERQADAVADRVVANRSAQDLLDEGGGGQSSESVQAKCACGGTCPNCAGGSSREDDLVQMQLEVNATRRFEPTVAPMAEEDEAGSAGGGAGEGEEQEEASACKRTSKLANGTGFLPMGRARAVDKSRCWAVDKFLARRGYSRSSASLTGRTSMPSAAR